MSRFFVLFGRKCGLPKSARLVYTVVVFFMFSISKQGKKSTMDPITSAIVAAISAGAIGGLTEVGKTALTDAYGKLKALLVKKFGHESDVVQAVAQVEAKPASQARKAMLAQEVAAVRADHDAELLH